MSRQIILKKIINRIKPKLYATGYKIGFIGDSRPYLVAPLANPKNLDGFAINRCEGFSELGVIEEFHIAAVTVCWEDIPLEDLRLVWKLIRSSKTKWQTAHSASQDSHRPRPQEVVV